MISQPCKLLGRAVSVWRELFQLHSTTLCWLPAVDPPLFGYRTTFASGAAASTTTTHQASLVVLFFSLLPPPPPSYQLLTTVRDGCGWVVGKIEWKSEIRGKIREATRTETRRRLLCSQPPCIKVLQDIKFAFLSHSKAIFMKFLAGSEGKPGGERQKDKIVVELLDSWQH